MALATSGALSVGIAAGQNQNPKRSINEELGVAVTTTQTLGNAALRDLAGVSSGAISFSDFYGKSAGELVLDQDVTSTGIGGGGTIATYGTGYTSASPNPVVTGSPAIANGDDVRITITDNLSNIKVKFECQFTVTTNTSFPFFTTWAITGGTITNISTPSGASVNSSNNTILDVPSGTFSYPSGTPATKLSFSGTSPTASTPNFITGSNSIIYAPLSGSTPPNAIATEGFNLKIHKI